MPTPRPGTISADSLSEMMRETLSGLPSESPFFQLIRPTRGTWQAPAVVSLHEAFTQPSMEEIAGGPPINLREEALKALTDWRMAEAGSGSRGSGMAGSVIGRYRGVEIVADPNLTEYVEDWSDVRSPSRARRRRAQGHKQRIKLVPAQNMVMVAGRIHASLAAYQRLRQQLDDQLMTALFKGGPDGRG